MTTTTSTTSNKRQGGEKRGNSTDRKNSRENLVRFWGNGSTVECVYCGMTLRNMTANEISAYNADHDRPYGTTPPMHVTRDRIDPNKGYTMRNLVPACFDCNNAASDSTWADRFPQVEGDTLKARAASYTPRRRK